MRCLVLFIITILLSCTNKGASDKNTIVVALESMPSSLDPRFAVDANGQRIANLIFNSLIKHDTDLKIIGDAAKSWEYSNLSYIFHLQKGLHFSNGQPLTKEDIVFTLNQYLGETSPFKTNFKNIKSFEVDDSSADGIVVTLKLSEFNSTLLNELTVLKLLSKSETLKSDFAQNPIGTGSFKIIKKEANSLLLESRNDHPIFIPKIKSVEIKAIADDNTRYLKVLKGDIDVAQNIVPTSKVKEFETNENFVVYKFPGPSMNYLLLNLKDPLLKNLYMRQILNISINRDEIIEFKLSGLATKATSILPPNNVFHNSNLKAANFDLERAKALIHMHKLEGKEFVIKTSNTQEVVEIAKVIANQLEKTGLKVSLQSFEWNTFFSDVKSGNFQLAIMRWVGVTDPDIYRQAFHSKEFPPGRNRGHYSNPLLDKLLDRGLSIQNEVKKIEHYKIVQKIVHEDLPTIPLWYNTQVAILSKRVKNFKPYQNCDLLPLLEAYKE